MRVVVAEDSMLFREGLIRLLADMDHDVVAAVPDGDRLRSAVDDLVPDLVIADVRMPPQPDSAGAVAATHIRARHPGVGILLLSQHVELRACSNLLGTPGFGYLLKDRVLHLDEFADALRRVATGGVALDSDVVRSLVRARNDPTGIGTLTMREREVLHLVAQGHSNTGVAALLALSGRTVEAHLRGVFAKLGLHDDGTTNRRVSAVLAYLDLRDG